MNRITASQLQKALLPYSTATTTNPQNEKGECLYVDENGNHCIIGQALSDLGFSDNQLLEFDNASATFLEIWDSDETAEYVGRLQAFADGHLTGDPYGPAPLHPRQWHEALALAAEAEQADEEPPDYE